jgi:predicted small lipoprotein YifL
MNSVASFRFRPSWHAACAILLLASTVACGYRGPLYMPDPQPDMIEVRKPGTPASSPEKKNRNTGAAQTGPAQSDPAGGAQPSEDTEDE